MEDMAALMRLHILQSFALCKLRYAVLGWDAYQHVYMVWAHSGFYNFYTLLLTQFSQYHSYILFYLTIYLYPPIFGCKYDVILTSPTCMLKTTYVFTF